MIKGQFGIEWRKKQAGDGPSDFLRAMRETRKCRVGMENSNACRDPGGCGVGVGREHKSSPSVCCHQKDEAAKLQIFQLFFSQEKLKI